MLIGVAAKSRKLCSTGRQIQSFWGRQARNPYQCDHAFIDVASAQLVADCQVLPYEPVRELSDHSPLLLLLEDVGTQEVG